MPKPRPTPTVRLRRLAAEIKRLREAAGLTQEEVSERTGKDRSTLYRLESAQQRPQRATLIQLLDLYGASPEQRTELLTVLREVGQLGWMQPLRAELPPVYSDYIGFESEARTVSNYESLFIPAYSRPRPTPGLSSRAPCRTRVQKKWRPECGRGWNAKPCSLGTIHAGGGRSWMRLRSGGSLVAGSVMRSSLAPAGGGGPAQRDGSGHPIRGWRTSPECPERSSCWTSPTRSTRAWYTESLAGGLFLEDDLEIRRYILLFDHLRAAAMRPGQTLTLLAEIAEEKEVRRASRTCPMPSGVRAAGAVATVPVSRSPSFAR